MTFEEKLVDIGVGTDPQKPIPISFSSKLSKEEKLDFIMLLNEFKDIFTWEYSKMPRQDLRLVVHTLNVKLGARLVA